MAQTIENIFRKNNICSNAVANREVSLTTLRNVVIAEGHSFDVFLKIAQMRS